MSDLIYRAEAQTELQLVARRYTLAHEAHGEGTADWIANLITVTDATNALRKVPSARINLNERIKVKLTDYGKEIYYHRFDDLFRQTELSVFKPEFPKTDEEGYTTFQLWDFIHIYGNYIDMGLPAVIKPLEIVYVGD